jgi:hypothetical protein
MGNAKCKFSLWIILIAFFVIVYFMAVLYDSPGRTPESWMVLFISMVLSGLAGAVIGDMLGGIVGLVGKLFKKNIFIPSLKCGAT